MFTTECGLSVFSPALTRKQVAYHRTVNFFAHLQNGKDMMTLFLYSHDHFNLETFANFIQAKNDLFKISTHGSKFGFVPNVDEENLKEFLEHAYGAPEDASFKELNRRLIPYYLTLLDGLILAAKIATAYFQQNREFTLDHLTRIERNHYYDNSYNMAYVPSRYAAFLRAFIHETRSVELPTDYPRSQTIPAALDSEIVDRKAA